MPGPLGTPVLDDFNRADEGPPPSASWTNWIDTAHDGTGLKVTSNVCNMATAAAGYRDAGYWNVDSFADVEVFATASALPANTEDQQLAWRLTTVGVGTTNGYELVFQHDGGGNPIWLVRRIDNDVETTLGATLTDAFVAGDQIAVSMIGSLITVRLNGTAIATRSDSTYSAAGRIGAAISFSPGTGRLDNFGGGTVAAAGRIYKRFYGPALLPAAAADLYTVPWGKRIRVLDTHVSNPSAGAVDLTLSIGADAAGTRVYDGLSIPADSRKDDFTPYELAAGEKIQGFASSAATLNLTITGLQEDA